MITDSPTIISFRYQAKYGHFRKPYSNVSSLSYPFPPRTALAGLLGAILGIPKAEVPLIMDTNNLKIAVEIEKPIKTITHVTNFRKDGAGRINYSIKRSKRIKKQDELKNIPDWNAATQIPQELLRYPSYIIYVSLRDNMGEFISRIRTKRFVYTPCMGLSGFLAELDYISEGVGKQLDPGQYDVSTVTDKAYGSLSLDWLDETENKHVLEVLAPHLGSPDRRFTYKRYLLNMLSKPLPLNMTGNSYEFEHKIISFL